MRHLANKMHQSHWRNVCTAAEQQCKISTDLMKKAPNMKTIFLSSIISKLPTRTFCHENFKRMPRMLHPAPQAVQSDLRVVVASVLQALARNLTAKVEKCSHQKCTLVHSLCSRIPANLPLPSYLHGWWYCCKEQVSFSCNGTACIRLSNGLCTSLWHSAVLAVSRDWICSSM